MKITLGEWKTRDGRKAVVVAENPHGTKSQKLVGWVGEHVQAWCINGAWSSEEGNNSKLDLVAPWTDPVPWDWSTTPPWINWIAMDANGKWFMFEKEPFFTGSSWESISSSVHRIPDIHSPQWSGDWKLSKTMRPKEVAK